MPFFVRGFPRWRDRGAAMRGIAMAIVGATWIWALSAVADKFRETAEYNNAVSGAMFWLIATVIVIAGG